MAKIPDGAVIVGVSTRSGSPAALAWGAKYASKYKLPLIAVMVYRQPRAPGTPSVRPPAVPKTAPDELSAPAELIVLGSPRDTTVSAHRLAGRLIHEAGCPVVVMPPIEQVPEGKVRATGRKLAQATADAAAKSGRPGLRPPRT